MEDDAISAADQGLKEFKKRYRKDDLEEKRKPEGPYR